MGENGAPTHIVVVDDDDEQQQQQQQQQQHQKMFVGRSAAANRDV